MDIILRCLDATLYSQTGSSPLLQVLVEVFPFKVCMDYPRNKKANRLIYDWIREGIVERHRSI